MPEEKSGPSAEPEKLGTCEGPCECYKTPHKDKYCTSRQTWKPVDAAHSTPPAPATTWTQKEQAVINELCAKLDFSEHALMRQGLRICQLLQEGTHELRELYPAPKLAETPVQQWGTCKNHASLGRHERRSTCCNFTPEAAAPAVAPTLQQQIEKLSQMTDEQIDTSDIPETDFTGAVRGKFYRGAVAPTPQWSEFIAAVARGWCHDPNKRKAFDSALAEAIVAELEELAGGAVAETPRHDNFQRGYLEPEDDAPQPKKHIWLHEGTATAHPDTPLAAPQPSDERAATLSANMYNEWRSGYGEHYVRPQDAWDAGWAARASLERKP